MQGPIICKSAVLQWPPRLANTCCCSPGPHLAWPGCAGQGQQALLAAAWAQLAQLQHPALWPFAWPLQAAGGWGSPHLGCVPWPPRRGSQLHPLQTDRAFQDHIWCPAQDSSQLQALAAMSGKMAQAAALCRHDAPARCSWSQVLARQTEAASASTTTNLIGLLLPTRLERRHPNGPVSPASAADAPQRLDLRPLWCLLLWRVPAAV